MPLPVSDILARASKTLYDETNVVWSGDELVAHLNAGIAAIVQIDPMAYVVNKPVALAAGARQVCPPDAVALNAVRRNLGYDGATAGRMVSLVSLRDLDESDPLWPTRAASDAITEYGADERDPRVFYVNPPAIAGTFVEMSYHGVPDNIAAADDFPLPALYENGAYYFTVAHALMREGGEGANWSRGGQFLAMFNAELGGDAAALVKLQTGMRDG